ncbi:hypothetical protein [Arthrobacter sp. D1-17]
MSNHTQLFVASAHSRRSRIANGLDPMGRAIGNWPDPMRARIGSWPNHIAKSSCTSN